MTQYAIKFDWKPFNVNCGAIHEWCKANAGDKYNGTQAAAKLELWFNDMPDQDIIDAVNAYWEAIDEESEIATSYMSGPAITAAAQVEKAAKQASAKAKLITLGLSEDEANAVLGL